MTKPARYLMAGRESTPGPLTLTTVRVPCLLEPGDIDPALAGVTAEELERQAEEELEALGYGRGTDARRVYDELDRRVEARALGITSEL